MGETHLFGTYVPFAKCFYEVLVVLKYINSNDLIIIIYYCMTQFFSKIFIMMVNEPFRYV